jgi:hypothetical protein
VTIDYSKPLEWAGVPVSPYWPSMVNRIDDIIKRIKNNQTVTEEESKLANDKQIGGDHYKKHGIQPWDYVLANNLGYLEGTAIKYITRWRDKGGIDDIRKAIHFLEKLIEHESNPSPGSK